MAFFDLMSGCPTTYSVFKDLKVKLIGFFKFMVLENMSKTLVIPQDFYYFHLEMLVPLVDYSQCWLFSYWEDVSNIWIFVKEYEQLV